MNEETGEKRSNDLSLLALGEQMAKSISNKDSFPVIYLLGIPKFNSIFTYSYFLLTTKSDSMRSERDFAPQLLFETECLQNRFK